MASWAVTTANDPLEFDTVSGLYNSCFAIDANHFINFWAGEGNDGYVQAFVVNTTTWAVTTAADRLEFDTVNGAYNFCYQIDANHFINFWSGETNDGYVQVFAVNTTTWAVTTAANRLEFDTVINTANSCYKVDTNHFVNFYSGETSHNYAQVFAVNTTTWAVTTAAARLEFDTAAGGYHDCCPVDANHFINFWSGLNSDGYAQVFTVSTSNWSVTTAANSLNFDTSTNYYNNCYQIDSNHFINVWMNSAFKGNAQVFAVNTSTWAVTTANAILQFDTVQASEYSIYQIDANHFICFWSGSGSDGYVQVLAIDTSTWAVTTAAASLEFDVLNGRYNSCFLVDTNHFIDFWSGDGSDGYAQVFTVELPAVGGAFNVAWARRVNQALGAGVANVS